jgi:branched-chain amino acid aminotransferase
MLELLSDTRIDLADSRARFGEGLFETIRVRNGAPCCLEAHLRRLAEGARFLGLDAPPEPERLRAFLATRTPCPGLASGVLRLLAVDARLMVTVAPWAEDRPERIELGLSGQFRRFSGSPLNRFKTFAYLENRLLAREAGERGWFEAIAANEHGRLTDGSRTSLFLVLDGLLVTPPAADGALPGVARARLLASGLAREAPLLPVDLGRAAAILLCNALRGAIPVHRLHADGNGPLDAGHSLLRQAAGILEAAP